MSDESSNWEQITYDLWADGEGGYSVNESFATGRVFEIDDESDTGIIRFLRGAGMIDEDVDEMDIDIDGDEDVIYINYKGTPAMEFRRTDKAVTYGVQ